MLVLISLAVIPPCCWPILSSLPSRPLDSAPGPSSTTGSLMVVDESRALLVSPPVEQTAVTPLKPKQTARQVKSCKVCRLRKVKCDRVKPCHACCAHGYPSKCVYDCGPDEDLQPVSQAEEIRHLRAEIQSLTAQLNNRSHQQQKRAQRRQAQLQNLVDSIRSAPLDVVDQIVRDIRATRGDLSRETVSVGPWEGTEAYDDQVFNRYATPETEDNAESQLDYPGYTHFIEYNFNRSASEDSDSTSNSIPSMNSPRPMMDVFIERFVDAFSPEVDVKSGQAGALRRAAEIRMFSPILTEAFEAVSVAFFGRCIQDKRIEMSGSHLYPRVLRKLQRALHDPERSRAESTLATVILLMAFESVERTSQVSLVAHVHGAVRLIEHRGPDSHVYGVEHLLFTELRPYWVGAALAMRAPSFLAREDWISVPWSAGTTKKDILHHLLDLTVEVPALLSQYDELEGEVDPNVFSAHETSVKQASLWNAVADLTARLLEWKVTWVDDYPDGPPEEVIATESTMFPLFQCRDLRTGAIITPTKFVYPDLRLAQTMCLYYTTRLVLSSVDTRPTDRVGPAEQYALGCGICRTLEWYILTAPGNMINRLAFPVRVAWEVFPDGGPERKFMIDVLKLVEKRHSLALWGSVMPELSPRAGSPPRTL